MAHGGKHRIHTEKFAKIIAAMLWEFCGELNVASS